MMMFKAPSMTKKASIQMKMMKKKSSYMEVDNMRMARKPSKKFGMDHIDEDDDMDGGMEIEDMGQI